MIDISVFLYGVNQVDRVIQNNKIHKQQKLGYVYL